MTSLKSWSLFFRLRDDILAFFFFINCHFLTVLRYAEFGSCTYENLGWCLAFESYLWATLVESWYDSRTQILTCPHSSVFGLSTKCSTWRTTGTLTKFLNTRPICLNSKLAPKFCCGLLVALAVHCSWCIRLGWGLYSRQSRVFRNVEVAKHVGVGGCCSCPLAITTLTKCEPSVLAIVLSC